MQNSFDLKSLIDSCDKQLNIYKHRLRQGDQSYLKTINSIYVIKVTELGEYMVSGGWFDRQNLSPLKINIRGCTWGVSYKN